MPVLSNDLIALGWTQLWQVTVVALAMTALSRIALLKRPRLAYLLWMIVIVKAITPPIWSSSTSVFRYATSRRDLSASSEVVLTGGGERFRTTNVRQQTLSPPNTVGAAKRPVLDDASTQWTRSHQVLLVWLAGVCGFAALVLVRWLQLQSRLSSSKCEETGLTVERHLVRLASKIGIRRPVRVCITEPSLGPAVVGWWRPVVLLPEALLHSKPLKELEPILVHELVHVRRGDTLIGRLQLLIRIVWWFHPLIWWANRELRRERERCVDEEVISGCRCQPAQYVRILLDAEVVLGPLRRIPASPAIYLSNVNVERLEEIMKRSEQFTKRTPIRYWLLAAAVGLMVLPGDALTTETTAGAQSEERTVAATKVGEKLTPFKALSVGRTELTERTIAGTSAPAMICFINRTTESTLKLIRTLEHYASQQKGLSRDYVFFASAFRTDDQEKILDALRGSFPKLVPSISLDKGSTEFGLSPDAGLTVLVINDGRLVKRFSFGTVELFRDGEGILKTLAEQVKKPVPSLARIYEDHRKERRAWYEREANRKGRLGKERLEGASPDRVKRELEEDRDRQARESR